MDQFITNLKKRLIIHKNDSALFHFLLELQSSEVFPCGILTGLYCVKFGDFRLQILETVVLELLTLLSFRPAYLCSLRDCVMTSCDVPKHTGVGIHRELVLGPLQIPKPCGKWQGFCI